MFSGSGWDGAEKSYENSHLSLQSEAELPWKGWLARHCWSWGRQQDTARHSEAKPGEEVKEGEGEREGEEKKKEGYVLEGEIKDVVLLGTTTTTTASMVVMVVMMR